MTVARTVADVLAEHVVFDVECIDRMYLNLYQPRLQYPAGLVGYVHRELGLPIASTAPLAKITDRFARAVRRFAQTEGIPWVDFSKGQRKDDVMHEHLKYFTPAEGVVFIGRAQEKTTVFRTEKRHHPDGVAYPWIVKTTVRVADRMRELYASERGSASPEVAGLLFAQLALIVGLFCLFWSFRGGDSLIPLWLSWALVIVPVPVAGLLWHFAVADLPHR